MKMIKARLLIEHISFTYGTGSGHLQLLGGCSSILSAV